MWLQGHKVRAGIVGIERNLQQKHQATDKSISQAFEDLSKLMEKVSVNKRTWNIKFHYVAYFD